MRKRRQGVQSEDREAMNKWLLATILAAAALFMYASIFFKISGG